MYFLGHYVDSSPLQAKYWWEKAQSHDEALYGLGMIYHQGAEGIPQDSTKAIEYWEKASDMLNEAATAALYKFYKNRPQKEKIINVQQITHNVVDTDEMKSLKIQLSSLQEHFTTLEYTIGERFNDIQVAYVVEKKDLKKRLKNSEKALVDSNNKISELLDRISLLEKQQSDSKDQLSEKLSTLCENMNSKIETLAADENRKQIITVLEKLSNRVSEMEHTHTNNVSNINERLDTFNENLQDKLSSIQNNIAATPRKDLSSNDKEFDSSNLSFVMDRIDNIEKKLGTEISKTKNSISEIQTKNITLEERVDRLEEKVNKLQNTFEGFDVAIKNIKESVSILSKARQESSKDISIRFESLSNRINTIEKNSKPTLEPTSSSESIELPDLKASRSTLNLANGLSSNNLTGMISNGSSGNLNKIPNKLARQGTKLDLGDGTLKRGRKNLKAYIEIMLKVRRRVSKNRSDDQLLVDVFKSFDRQGTGFVTANDFRIGLMTAGIQLPIFEIKALMHEIGAEDTGQFNFEMFLNAYNLENAITVTENTTFLRKSSNSLIPIK